MANPTITEGDRDRVTLAVSAVEATTAGEIVTIVAEQSDSYRDVALAWALGAAVLALTVLELAPHFHLGMIDRVLGNWATEWTPRAVFAVALAVVVLKFAVMMLVQLWRPLRLALVPGRIKSRRTRARAVMCFKVGAERRTHGRTGILIYLSLAEHRAEIVADAAIAGKVEPEVWGEAMAAMLAHIREGRIADGMIAAVDKVGAVLAEHFPRAENDTNELPDRLIEV
jgi:putative membrane protein